MASLFILPVTSSCRIAGQYGNLVRGRPNSKTGGGVVRVLDSADVGWLASMAEAIAARREAFAAADRGGPVMPAPFGMYLPDVGGEVHVKGAYLAGAPVFAVKTATGFYSNAGLGASGQRRDDHGP
jgi:hypothetical protein